MQFSRRNVIIIIIIVLISGIGIVAWEGVEYFKEKQQLNKQTEILLKGPEAVGIEPAGSPTEKVYLPSWQQEVAADMIDILVPNNLSRLEIEGIISSFGGRIDGSILNISGEFSEYFIRFEPLSGEKLDQLIITLKNHPDIISAAPVFFLKEEAIWHE